MALRVFIRQPSKLLIFPLAVILTAAGLLLNVIYTLAVVDLRNFSVTARETDILVTWETATELDNAGFFVLRSLSENGDYIEASDFIDAKGDQFIGANYEWVDVNVEVGVRYWYRLESFDFNSGSQVYDPESAMIGGETPTLTIEPSATSSPTPTNTNTATTSQDVSTTSTPTRTSRPGTRTSTATITRTSTPRPTNTPQPLIPTATWTNSPTFAPATATRVSGSPTITFIPIPSVTFVVSLADPGQDQPALEVEEDLNPEKQPDESEQPEKSWFTPQRIIVIGVIGLIWVLLGGWFFLSMRQIDV